MSQRPNALITGGCTGIGLGIAMAMVDAGYAVTATGLSEAQVASLPRRDFLSGAQLDVTSSASVAAVLAPFQDLAALINCAGIIFRNHGEYDIENFQKVIEVNLTGTMRMCVAARAKLGSARVYRQHGLNAVLLRRPGGPRLHSIERGRRAAHQGVGSRLGRRGHPRERDRAGLDCDGVNTRPGGRC
jgi:NAD(P)-dependent dehydrogenase (short-subunit alcohol dehydrogenase family)